MKKEPLRFNSWTLGGRGADLFGKSAEALELERMNPLRGVDEWRLGQIFDDARDGVFADLAWLYNEIEGVEPALMACCDARESAAGELGWVVRTADPNRTRGFDESLAGEQRDALLAEFGAVADDIPDLAGHMVSAFFRGAAHALPLWNADGSLAGFRHLDLWNFAFDRGTGVWYWNADASRDEGTFRPVPPGETVSLAVSSSRHVDHAALPIFIRAALGAKRYGVWLDRFGIPPVAVIMPPNAERGEQGAYMDLARKFARGGSGVLPNGSQVAYGTEARSVCPFPDFIRFQQQQIYAVGLGRVQSGENQGDNLGGNAAGVVDSALRRIVRRDARRIARAVNDCVTRRVLERLFPGRPALARFDFDTDPKRTGREALEDAVIARNAGMAIDRAQLEEMTGYTLADAPEPANPGGFAGFGRALNSRNPSSAVAKALQNARKGEGATDIPPNAAERSTALLRDFAADMAPAAKRIKSLLDMFDGVEQGTGNGEQGTDEAMAAVRDEARKLAAELPDLMPDDPAMAAALEEAMAQAFAEGAGGETLANEAGECRAKDPAHCPVHGTPETKSRNDGRISFGNQRKREMADDQAKARGYAGIDDLMSQSASVPQDRIDALLKGGGDCRPHEAVAVLRSGATIPAPEGEQPVKLGEFALRHYACGDRRSGPDIDRLAKLPTAIAAIRKPDGISHELDDKPVLPGDGGSFPKGTQTIYRKALGRRSGMNVYAYTDSGVLSGWMIER